MDIAFPEVDARMKAADIAAMGDGLCAEILAKRPSAALCQGEMTLSHYVVNRLKRAGIPVLAACSRRETRETVDDDGNTVKQSRFVFEGFREYS